jgi:methylmalonyl-CoA mutase N-terminal domain/subunit
MNMERHRKAHKKLYDHLAKGEARKARIKDFYDEYFAVLDLTEEFYVETVDRVFQKAELATGHDVCRPPWTIRQYAGFSTAEESNAFYPQPRRRAKGPVGRLRPRHPSRLRQRPSARRRRCRQGRRRDRQRRGHEDPVRRHPARQDVACR